ALDCPMSPPNRMTLIKRNRLSVSMEPPDDLVSAPLLPRHAQASAGALAKAGAAGHLLHQLLAVHELMHGSDAQPHGVGDLLVGHAVLFHPPGGELFFA